VSDDLDFEVVKAKVLQLEPGDAIALVCADVVSVEQAKLLREQGEAAFPGHTVVVLSGGVDVAIVREPVHL
jgi:hypothetical protein